MYCMLQQKYPSSSCSNGVPSPIKPNSLLLFEIWEAVFNGFGMPAICMFLKAGNPKWWHKLAWRDILTTYAGSRVVASIY